MITIKIGDDHVALTDAGNAQLFAHEHGADLRWVPDWGTWLRYDGKRWVRTPSESMIPLAIRTARGFYARAAAEDDDDRRKVIAMHAKATESAGRLEAMIKLARGLLVAASSAFDRDPFLINVANRTLDLRGPEGDEHEHRRDDMLTKITPVDFDPEATCPIWDTFLEKILPDKDVRSFVQRFAGYCLTGDVSEQVLAFLHGRGSNGKSTLIEVLLAVLGEYAKPGAPDLLLAKSGEAHPTELADLQGARLVICQETEAGRAWAEKTVKWLTGGDKIKARWMRCDFFDFAPSHKLIVSANHKPKVRGQDDGIWRRIMLVPFTVTIPKREADKKLVEKLKSEAPGILLWLIKGCLDWQAHGLGEPPAVVEATRDYRQDQDQLGGFVAEVIADLGGQFVATTTLYEKYLAWCSRNGASRPWERDSFREGLAERGFEDVRRNAARGFRVPLAAG